MFLVVWDLNLGFGEEVSSPDPLLLTEQQTTASPWPATLQAGEKDPFADFACRIVWGKGEALEKLPSCLLDETNTVFIILVYNKLFFKLRTDRTVNKINGDFPQQFTRAWYSP